MLFFRKIVCYEGGIMKFICPTFVMLPRKTKADKKFSLNLNIYRNTHHSVLNQAKQIFNEQLKSQLQGLSLEYPISITFQYFKPSKRISDKANVISIVEKFFCDSLVKWGAIPDDNDNYILYQMYLPTIYDKNNGRVEICITEAKELKK